MFIFAQGTSMSLSYYYALLFSPELSHSGADEKRNAIVALQDYLEARPEIKTGERAYHSIAYAAEPYLNGRINLAEIFRAKVIHAELTQEEFVDVRRLGFSARVVGPTAYEFYRDSYVEEGALHVA